MDLHVLSCMVNLQELSLKGAICSQSTGSSNISGKGLSSLKHLPHLQVCA